MRIVGGGRMWVWEGRGEEVEGGRVGGGGGVGGVRGVG